MDCPRQIEDFTKARHFFRDVRGIVAACLCGVAFAGSAAQPDVADEGVRSALARIGQWDGTTESAELAGPYEDPLQQEMRFGQRSYYLSPWRAYMDTCPAQTFLDVLGMYFGAKGKQAEAIATVLADAGIRSARIEVGWGSMAWETPDRLTEGAANQLRERLLALKRAGIRPLILLNANSGWPCPIRQVNVRLVKDAAAGSRELDIDPASEVVPNFTGLRGQAYQVAFPLITAVDHATGRCALSATLKKDVKAGPLRLLILKYRPFAGSVLDDGTPNPEAIRTLEGWRHYVAGICGFVRDTLVTDSPVDAGFDIEVWNEYTFGSQFLEERHYYDPPRTFKQKLRYQAHGRVREGHEIILPITVDHVNDPANKLPGVRVISGFSNQRPWENGTDMWPGQAGFSRHYYTGLNPSGEFSGNGGLLCPGNDRNERSGPLNALGLADGTPDKKDWHTVIPGTFFVPVLRFACPESSFFGYKTEFIVRDVQPFPGPWSHHHRYSHPGTGRPAEVWQTEFNCWRKPWAERLMANTGVAQGDPRFIDLLHQVGAKLLLRSFVFQAHKGIKTVQVYAAHADDMGFGVFPSPWMDALKANDNDLTESLRADPGPQLSVVRRVVALMRQSVPMDTTRPLSVARLVERKPRLVFAGDGTQAHPDRHNRDDFACLPFQLDTNRYAVSCYVVTRNAVHEWAPDRDALDPARYSMPPQDFDLTLGNVRGRSATVSVYDPVTDRSAPVTMLAGDDRTLSVRLSATDYPRFLLIHEGRPGPQIIAPAVRATAEGVELSFDTNVPASPTVTWGRIPDRVSGGKRELPAGANHRCLLPPLGPNEGARVRVAHGGLDIVWPRWGWDVAGVLEWGRPDVKDDPATPALVRLPELPPGIIAESLSTTLPDGQQWQASGDLRLLTLGEGNRAVAMSLRLVRVSMRDATQLLPELSVTDRIRVERSDWNGLPAIRVELTLDPAAHPGLAETEQTIWLAPHRQGVVELTARGPGGSRRSAQEHVASVIEGVRFGICVRAEDVAP